MEKEKKQVGKVEWYKQFELTQSDFEQLIKDKIERNKYYNRPVKQEFVTDER